MEKVTEIKTNAVMKGDKPQENKKMFITQESLKAVKKSNLGSLCKIIQEVKYTLEDMKDLKPFIQFRTYDITRDDNGVVEKEYVNIFIETEDAFINATTQKGHDNPTFFARYIDKEDISKIGIDDNLEKRELSKFFYFINLKDSSLHDYLEKTCENYPQPDNTTLFQISEKVFLCLGLEKTRVYHIDELGISTNGQIQEPQADQKELNEILGL